MNFPYLRKELPKNNLPEGGGGGDEIPNKLKQGLCAAPVFGQIP